ncbi:hypothetical protein N1030_14735 [Desulfovibrio mangrovi]|uniref:hypothetical protein n=1 Tax=Desulfovibrio mangrovi TaxID=2976983 RepID=UPI002245EB17|nr:hypothetical protein [Desulfovibrio mangrovi]UZP66852.1 hypothetical protein N1030_14735 [Desulfovibrio mangrovi]
MKPLNRTTPVNWQGQGTTTGQETASRAAAFRRSHHVGQILHGKILRWVRGGMAWVHVGGQELLAQLHTTPEAGVALRFLVVQLVPEIILKEVDEDSTHATGHTLSPADIIRDYLAARDALDAHLHKHLWPTLSLDEDNTVSTDGMAPQGGAASPARNAFITHISQHEEGLALFTTLQHSLLRVNALLAASRSGVLCHLPWLLPEARGVEMLLPPRTEGTTKITFGAVFPASGHVLIQCLAGTERMAYRLFLERAAPKVAATVCRVRDARRQQHATQLSCLGCGPLPAGIHDVLTSILHPAGLSGSTSGSLNRRA